MIERKNNSRFPLCYVIFAWKLLLQYFITIYIIDLFHFIFSRSDGVCLNFCPPSHYLSLPRHTLSRLINSLFYHKILRISRQIFIQWNLMLYKRKMNKWSKTYFQNKTESHSTNIQRVGLSYNLFTKQKRIN